MSDPVAPAARAAELASTQAPSSSAGGLQRHDPAETRLFAHMMQGMPAPPSAATGGPGAAGDAARALAAQLSGNVRSFEDIRRSMLESVDMGDPIKTMVAMTDHAMEAHSLFARLHISTGLASAATSLFGGLLKNQQ